MAKTGNITMNITPSYEYTLTRTSYDLRQEINARVIGVLRYNNKIREKLLKRNIGQYSILNSEEGIGYISNLYSSETSKPFSLGEEGLLGYTHTEKSDYQTKINQKYGLGDSIQYYAGGSLPDSVNWRWKGLYDDYTAYIEETFGLPVSSLSLLSSLFKNNDKTNSIDDNYSKERNLTIQSVLNDFLQYDNIKYAMEQTRIGTVTPNPLAALAGAVTTNINNFSGTDTPLGLITNHLYAHALRNGAQFNSLRNTQYITPGVYATLGNKFSTINTLGIDNRIDPDTGRLAYEFGEGVGVRSYESLTVDAFESMDMIDGSKDVASSQNARYRNIIANYEHNGYMPFDGFQYVKNENPPLLYKIVNPYIREWNEGDKGNWLGNVSYITPTTTYEGIKDSELQPSLLQKTQELFKRHDENGIDTLIGRFHTSGGRDLTHNEANLLQTAISHYGMSHGRNLLNQKAYEYKSADKINGYENPYCRVWTYHHQYDKVGKLIRPFGYANGSGNYEVMGVDSLQSNWWQYGRRAGSAGRLRDNSVLNKNGFVNITPTSGNGDVQKAIDIKKCMFSIENLAWKNQSPIGSNQSTANPTQVKSKLGALSNEQKGPNGGRIMWFPPYDLKFNEQVNVNWGHNEFIGRGEKIYSYTNTERAGTLSFTLLVDHPSILDMWKKNSMNETDNVDDNEQKILRFFAGCGVLELNNKKLPIKEDVVTDNINDEEPVIPLNIESDSKNLTFYVFFPNNYSGIDDYEKDMTQFDERHITNVMEYLSGDYEVSDEGSSTGEKIYENYPWEYRIDTTKYLNQKLNESNYSDNAGFSLNVDLKKVLSHPDFEDATASFQDVYNNLDKKITELGVLINSVTVQGFASSHGYTNINDNELSANRAQIVSKWLSQQLKGKGGFDNSKLHTIGGGQIVVEDVDRKNASGESAKRARCVKVTIAVGLRSNQLDIPKMSDDMIDDMTDVTYVNQNINTTIQISERKLTKAQKRAKRKAARLTKKVNAASEAIAEEKELALNTDIQNRYKIDKGAQLDGMVYRDAVNKLRDSATKLLSVSEISERRNEYLLQTKQVRWDEEAQYFEMLEANDSFLYQKVVDKVKYFTPAFHSITPEGFNARLSFLHQCTRQGSTLGTSEDILSKSAGNLAFGRPPICVLRIGDFYHTKIIINSVTIDYEQPQWDMNPEGIGMQPMYAKISLNFTFLGGSDLEAPISRLQNAVSFNYYANQSIYDDRADIGIYDTEKQRPIIQGKPWLPHYELLNDGAGYKEEKK